MKALVKSKPEKGLWLEDVPVPKIGPRDVLIKVKMASICGTDLHIYKYDDWAKRNVPVGTTIGHEFMGEIVEVGNEAKNFKVGQRVNAEGHITCGKCNLCLSDRRHLCPETKVIGIHQNGAFAEYAAIPEENLFALPDYVKDEVASIFDPFGNAVHTASKAELKDQDVLITGAGPIGIMAVAIAKQAGAKNIVITDVNEYRLGLAKQMGATHIVNVAKTPIAEATKGLNISVGMEMSGVPSAFNDILKVAQNGATISLLGILPRDTLIDWDLVIFKMLTIKGIYGREIFNTWYQMRDLLKAGLNIEPIITHRLKFEDYEKGFEEMFSGNACKVVLEL